MALATGVGTAANSAVAVASLALPSITPTTGRDVYFNIVLGSTASSVTSITNSAGAYTSVALIAAKNGTGVRVELWKAHVGIGAATVFTVNIGGGNTTCSVEAEEYSGVTGLGSTHTASDNTKKPVDSLATTQTNNFVLTGFGFVTSATPTSVSWVGSQRQSSLGTSAVGGSLYDNTSLNDVTLQNGATLDTAQQWAAVSVELQGGGAAITCLDYAATTAPTLQVARDVRVLRVLEFLGAAFPPVHYTPVPAAQELKGGAPGVVYSETITAQGGTAPYTFATTTGALPSGTSLTGSTGVIAGTPSTPGTFNFTITVTDANGYTGSQAFTIVIAAPSGGSGGAYVFIG